MDYTDPLKNKFKYKLEGYDKDWSAATNVRYVSYTELPGGEYKFLVKSTNNDGVWNEVPLEIKIIVNPPWWKTKWFYTLSILLIIAGVFAFIRIRTANDSPQILTYTFLIFIPYFPQYCSNLGTKSVKITSFKIPLFESDSPRNISLD